MKFSLSLLALPALFVGSLAAPAPAEVGLQKRQISSAYTIVSNLYDAVQQYTGAINETAAGLNADSTAADNATAAASFISNVEAITALVTSATTEVDGLAPETSTKLAKRQTGATLAALVTSLLLEIGGALNGIIATLGLSKWISAVGSDSHD